MSREVSADEVSAFSAFEKATAAVAEIEKHEAVCAERYSHIQKSIASILGILKWVGTAAVGAIVSLGIWGVEQTIQNAQTKTADFNSQLSALRSQIAAQRPSAVVVTPPAPPQPVAPQPRPTLDPLTGLPEQPATP